MKDIYIYILPYIKNCHIYIYCHIYIISCRISTVVQPSQPTHFSVAPYLGTAQPIIAWVSSSAKSGKKVAGLHKVQPKIM